MIMSGIAKFVSAKKIEKNDGKIFFIIKILDENAENFSTFFTDADIYEKAEIIQKGSEVSLEIELEIGKTFCKLIEITEI